MGDVGDYWREARDHRRAVRATWHECPTCAVRYGTGTKTAPGRPCRNCGWVAPTAPVRPFVAPSVGTKSPQAKERPKCVHCGRRFKDRAALACHTRDKHDRGGLSASQLSAKLETAVAVERIPGDCPDCAGLLIYAQGNTTKPCRCSPHYRAAAA